MLEDTAELVKKIANKNDDEEDVEACVWGEKEPCRIVVYRSQLETLLDTSRYIDDSVILASLKSLESQDADVYTVDPLRLTENIVSWPNESTWAEMIEKNLTKDVFKVRIN